MSKLTTNVRLLSPAIKKKTAATLTAVVCAVLLPQLVHLCGIMSGSGNSLGEILLPMHLPVMIVGMLAGPVAGMATGLISPLVSFALTGMPAATVLPFMCMPPLPNGFRPSGAWYEWSIAFRLRYGKFFRCSPCG